MTLSEDTTADNILFLLKESYRRPVNEMAVPQVGLFYIINGEIRCYCEEARQAPLDNLGIRYVKFKHEDYWRIVKKVLEKTSPGPEMDWKYYPRGRVFYDEETRKFHIVADRCILNDEDVIKKVISEFHLPRDKAKIKRERDSHYRCVKCKSK